MVEFCTCFVFLKSKGFNYKKVEIEIKNSFPKDSKVNIQITNWKKVSYFEYGYGS